MNWQFDTRGVDDDIGWNNALITSFKNNRLKSLTCEILQNSLDNPGDDTTPVRVVFKEKTIKKDKFPDIEGLTSHIKACATEQSLETQNDDSKAEIQKALSVISDESIKVLEIADYNTTGMPGPDEKTKPFHSYIKTEGNASGGNHRGGSHGHGKAAPLSLSYLRTIFVSTAWVDEAGNLKKLFQGRATLKSHQLVSRNYDFKGYLGDKNFRAVSHIERKYAWLEREDKSGTTIRLMGWMAPSVWQELVIGYAIAIYFSAILRNELELEVGNYKLNKDTFQNYLNDEEFLARVKKWDENCAEEIDLARWFTKCLDAENDEVKNEEKQIHQLGLCDIKLLIDEQTPAPRKFGILRNNILITSSLSTFYKRHPSNIKAYVGLVECLDDDGYELLRRMEPPQHNDFTADMLQEADKETGKKALRNLGNGLKDVLRKYAEMEIATGSQVAWMADFFGDPAGDGEELDENEDIDPSGALVFTPKPKSPPPPKVLWDVEVQEPEPEPARPVGPDPGPNPKPKPPTPTPQPDDPDEPENNTIVQRMQTPTNDTDHTRFIAKSAKTGSLVVRASQDGWYQLSLYEVGADLVEPIEIQSLERAELDAGKHYVELVKGINRLQVEFERDLLGGLKPIWSKVNDAI